LTDHTDSDDIPAVGHIAAGIPSALIDSELARITRSKSFRQSRRHQKLLRHLVEQTIAGNLGALKEPVLALEVFERPIAAFDPARDTIVRVEARRLRQRLERYYGGEGRDAALEFRLPVGSYVPVLRRRAAPDDAVSRRAKDLVERGEYFLRQPLSQRTLEQALLRFDAALRDAPDHAPAYVGLGRAWLNLATGWYRDPRPAAEHAAEALRHALALDASHAVAHALLGAIQHQFEYDWPAARASFERALALAPRQAFVHSAYGAHLLARAEFDAAEHELRIARRLDPHYVNARMHMVDLRIGQRRFTDAAAELDALRDIAPDSMPAVGTAGLLALLSGDSATALVHYRRACELAPDHPNAYASLAAAQGEAGDVAGADATLAMVDARFGAGSVSPYVRTIVAARCGRVDRAFALLEEAIEVRDPSVMTLPSDPSFDALHADARWAALLARIGIGHSRPVGRTGGGATREGGAT
jgi:Tfp pilus assembly protein PilF